MRRGIAALLLTAPLLHGCLAAAAPLLMAGVIGKKQLDKRDPDLPSSRGAPAPVSGKKHRTAAVSPAAAMPPAGEAPPAGIPAAQAVPAGAAAATIMPVPGTVPPGMQYLYGSGEAAALSVQAYLGLTDFLLAKASDFAVGHPVNSVVLAPGATLADPKFLTCKAGQRPAVVLDIDETALMNLGYEADDSQRAGPYDQNRWERWETSGIGAVDPVPGALEAIRAVRLAGITVVFNSNRASANASSTASTLTLAGLGPVNHLDTLWLKGDGGGSGSGKDIRRWAISAKYCVIAMVGDQLGDFSDLFNAADLTPAVRRALTGSPRLRMLWGHGWFVLPNPVYGTGLKGDIDEVFPKSRRWSDPGPAMGVAPMQPPAVVPSPVATGGAAPK